MHTIGLALGAGGAKGLAHVPLLEELDQAGLRPSHLAGASIGAVLAALYASGMSGAGIRESVQELIHVPRSGWDLLFSNKTTLKIMDLLDPSFGRGGLLKGQKFLDFLEERLGVSTFEDLEVPLTICAADFWRREQVIYRSGPLLPAIKASMTLPGLLSPVKLDGVVLVDGAAVNPLPYDLLPEDCDYVIAVDVMGRRQGEDGNGDLPSLSETIFNTFQIMQRSILNEKLKHNRPDLLLEVDLSGIRTLDFHRAPEIYQQAESARRKLRRACRDLLE